MKPLKGCSLLVGMKGCSLLVGMAVICTQGIFFSFSSWENKLKDVMRLSQTQVSLLGYCAMLGNMSCVFGSLVYSRHGVRPTACLALLLGVTSSATTLLLTVYHVTVGAAIFVVLCALFFGTGVCNAILFVASMSVTLENFADVSRGKAVASLGVAMYGSGAAMSAVGSSVSMPTMLGVISCLQLVCSLLAMLLQRTTDLSSPAGQGTNEMDAQKAEKQEIEDDLVPKPQEHNEEKSSLIVKSPTTRCACLSTDTVDLCILLCCSSLLMCVANTLIYNVGTLLLSARQDQYTGVATIMGPIIALTVKFLVAVLSDALATRVPRICFVVFPMCAYTVVLIALATDTDSLTLLLVCVGCTYACYAIAGVIFLTVVAQRFPLKDVAWNVGVVFVSSGVVSIITQVLFGVFYDAHVSDVIGRTCYGSACFTEILVLLIAFNLITIATGVVYWMRNPVQ